MGGVMVERRSEPREAKRVMLSFTPVGEKRTVRAIALNVSKSGLYVASGTLFPKGTRLLVTIADDPDQKAVEFEVRNVRRVGESPGMGLRIVVSGKVADATGAFPLPQGKPTGIVETPQLPPDIDTGRAAEAPPPPTSSDAGTVFTMKFPTPEAYAETWKRDFKRGGAFFPASVLPQQDEIVLVEIVPPIEGTKPVVVEARVVFRGGGGFGVEFVNKDRVLASLPVPK